LVSRADISPATDDGHCMRMGGTIVLHKIEIMKKLLIPLDGHRYPQEMLDFVSLINPLEPVQLTAVFAPESDYSILLGPTRQVETMGIPFYEEEVEQAGQSRERLTQFCKESGIVLQVRMDQHDFALPDLLRESGYADLLLLNGLHFFEELDGVQPNAWMKEILHKSKCPVLLLPEKTTLPGELALAYDGSVSSVFAIRQFAYLFHEFCNVPATLVYVNNDPGKKVPGEDAITEFGKLHFKNFRIVKLNVPPELFYDNWLEAMNKPWVVTGSYGRSTLSQVIKGSFSRELIRRHRVPVFLAHC
jgi:hypothetical protein